MYNFNLRNCINEPTWFGALLDPIIYSDECEISFSNVIQVDRNISDYDATSASLRISLIRIAFLIDELNQGLSFGRIVMILAGIYIFANSINLFVNLIDISSMFSLESKNPSQSIQNHTVNWLNN
jgi:hypothetical protein